ncbi:MAG: hypothetical protein R3B93_23910 [Bacteroidia bacterium]
MLKLEVMIKFMRQIILLFLGIFVLSSTKLISQPQTDVFLFSIHQEDGNFSFKKLARVTNREGYDNQPYFTADGKALRFASIREGGKSDIYRYDIETGETVNVTNTPNTSEYSPIPIPESRYFSVVMVEEDDKTQKLWKFPVEGGEGERILDKVEPVGYYTWFKENTLAMFILGDVFTLQVVNIEDEGNPKTIAENIGRSIHTIPGTEQVSFVIKESDKKWNINRWNPDNGEIAPIAQTLEGIEDYCWHPQGFLLMGKDGELFMHAPEENTEWESLGNLEIGNFYRLSVSPDGKYLAVVMMRE